VQVLNGRYGPYITDGTKNARIPKDRDPRSLTLEECRALLAAAPERKGRRGATGKAAPKKKAAPRKKAAPKKKAAAKKKAAPKKKASGKKTAAKKGTSAGETGAGMSR
jgi:DNA topoisomerase I